MSGIGVILIVLCIGTACLVLAAIWILGRMDKRTALLSTGAAFCIASLLVSFIDVSPPVIRQRENTFSYKATPGINEIVSCYDNSDSTPKVTYVPTASEGFTYDKKTGLFSFKAIDKYMLTFHAVDKNKNSCSKTLAVHIIDDIPPAINFQKKAVAVKVQPDMPPADELSVNDSHYIRISEYTDQIATAYDEIDGDVSSTLAIDENKIDYTTPGNYIALVTATDSSDNIAEAELRVVIRP